MIADRLETYVTRAYLDRALEEQTRRLSDELTGTLTASWRRDLLLVSGAQFFALAAAAAALVALA